MEEAGGSKRRAGSSSSSDGGIEEPENQLNQAQKKAFQSVTPSWIPHATANQPAHQQAHNPTVKASAHEKKVRTISDSQRRFAAQFSSSTTKSEIERQGNPNGTRGSRWPSKPVGPAAPSNSPRESCGAEQQHLKGTDRHISIMDGVEENDEESGQGLQKTDHLGSKELQDNHGSLEATENEASSSRRSKGGLVKGPWTREEDQKILDCIAKNMTRWSEIAERVEGRIGKQCRERWFNHLDPTLRKSSWTLEEDEILVQGQARFGNSWTKIAKLLQGRSENAVKNRWNSAARKKGKAIPQRSMPDLAQITSTAPGRRPVDSEYVGFQQSAMPNEEQLREQMQYAKVPSAHHMNSRVAPSVAGPPSSMQKSPMLQHFPAGMRVDPSHGFPVHQHLPNQQAPLPPERPRPEGVSQRQGHPFRQMPPDQEVHGPPPPLPPWFLTPALPLGVANQGQHLLQPSSGATARPEDVFRGCANGAVTEEASGASAGSFQSLLHDGQPLPDTARVFSTDELSLSNTLLNLSLDEQATTAGGGCSGSRKASDWIGNSAGRLDSFDACGGDPTLRSLMFGDSEGFGSGYLKHDGVADGSLPNQGLQRDRFRRNGPTESSQLLLAPAHAQTGTSQVGTFDRSEVAGT